MHPLAFSSFSLPPQSTKTRGKKYSEVYLDQLFLFPTKCTKLARKLVYSSIHYTIRGNFPLIALAVMVLWVF